MGFSKSKYTLISFIGFVVAMVLLTVLCIPIVKSFGNPEALEEFSARFGVFKYVMLLVVQIIQIIVALVPGEVVEFAAGVLCGPVMGLVVCLVGVLVGQWMIFVAVKKWGNSLITVVLDSDFIKKFKFLNDEKKVKIFTFILYFLPGTPKDLLTYFMPITKIDVKSFLVITMIARIPSVVSSTIAGGFYSEGNLLLTVIVYGVVAVFSFAGYMIYKFCFDRGE